jgi:cytochrome c-type biogenesis protein CcmE
VNKRARNRLIGVTAIILVIIAAIFAATVGGTGAYYKTVAEISKDPSLVGKRVQVGGAVVENSWDKKTRPMKFAIRDQGAAGGPELLVVYNGNVPNTFGNGVTAIVTGDLSKIDTIDASELVVKCPEKDAVSRQTAMKVDALVQKKATLTGKPVQVVGFVVSGSLTAPGEAERFSIQTTKTSGPTLKVKFDGAVPAGFGDGTEVALGGQLDTDGFFDATSVSLVK